MSLLILKDFYRKKFQTLLKIALSFLLLFFLFLFCNNIERNQRELQNIYDTYEVKMVLRNVETEKEEDEEETQGLQKEELRQAEHDYFVKDVDYIAKVSLDTLMTADFFGNNLSEEITVYLQRQLDALNEQYLVGDDTKDLADDQYIASESFAVNADAITFALEDKQAFFEGTKRSDCLEQSLYLNFTQFERICMQLELPYHLDIAVYSLKNTRELDAYRAYLDQQPIIAQKKCEYFIFDGTLQDATRPLKQIIAMMEVFLPIVFFLIGVLAFFVSYVSSRGERQFLFLLYSLGVEKRKRFFYVWGKEMLCCLISVLPGMLLLNMKYIGFYVLSFALGSCISTIAMITNVKKFVQQEG